MLEIFRALGLVFVIYPDDHDPPHVHLRGAGWEIKVTLDATPGLAVIRGEVAHQQARKVLELVRLHYAALLNAWREIHG